ncbi:orotidine-5'-phosphate decarboxylase [Salimicrobium sp. PL1-032A]|uniref:orotidine-5'-phosphate decarboxylase n=1 Tax=Salimicrobium sp. PL1-032A TaxID=3095364 RepID=UPI00326071F2
MKQMHPLYIALDFSDGERAIHFLEVNKLQGVPVKVGMELFYKEGPLIVQQLRKRGHPVFLDVKVHDIPNTAEGAVRSLASLDIDVLTVHAQGGKEMMHRAKQAAGEVRVLAVTHLTSMTEEVLKEELGVHDAMEEIIPRLAVQAEESGVDGVVCSVHEVSSIKAETGKDFLTLTPGIRLEGEPSHDQKRTATPERARENGADVIVVGRAITQAKDPRSVYDYIKKELERNEPG